MLFQFPSGAFIPTGYSSSELRLRIGRPGLAMSRNLQHTPELSHAEVPISDSQQLTSGYRYSRFRRPALPTRELRTRDATCDTPHNLRGTRRDSHSRGPSALPLVPKSPKYRDPDSTESRATCPRSNRRSRLSREITTRDLVVHAILTLANPDIPMHDDPFRFLPVLEDFFLQEVQVADSLPLEEFSVSHLCPM
jgi:hypothetical protein